MENQQFEEAIAPFFWFEHSGSAFVCLNAGEYKQALFETRCEEGFQGNGYDWTALAQVFLTENFSELQQKIRFDPEAGMFSADSTDIEFLRKFTLAFKQTCESDELIRDIFSRAQLN